MKDKIKKIKEIDDNSTIPKINPEQKVILNWNVCVICGLDLHKKSKKRIINGISYTSFNYKKHYRLCDKKICWECAFKITKEFKHDKKNT